VWRLDATRSGAGRRAIDDDDDDEGREEMRDLAAKGLGGGSGLVTGRDSRVSPLVRV